MMLKHTGFLRAGVLLSGIIVPGFMTYGYGAAAMAQTPAAAPAGRQIGTVKSIDGSVLTLKTDAGQEVAATVADGARILQLAPGSTDLKSAQTITLKDIAVGDRVLVSGKPGDTAATFAAARVILMKSTDIAQRHEAEQADWQKRGTGGIVSAVDTGTGAVMVSVGAKKLMVNTSSTTKFRRYAGDSVKFEDATPGTLAQIQVGDQLRVRGAKSEDGSSIQAEEVVSGSFKNLAGLIATLDAAKGTLTLKDLATKKMVTVKVTENSSVRALPPQAAARFAARAKGGAAGGGGEAPSSPQGGAPAGAQGGGDHPGGPGRSAGMDLSQLVSRLPNQTIADLKVGEAVMIVASQPDPGSPTVTAVTLLSGVEPILAATPSGTPSMTLSPWSVGSGAPEGGTQ
jgi:co-chaperonin GroES (HSP10)